MENTNYENENIEIKYLNTWYDWLINYNPEPIRKIVNNFKDTVVSLFKQTVYGSGNRPNKQKEQSDKNIIKSIRNLSKLKK